MQRLKSSFNKNLITALKLLKKVYFENKRKKMTFDFKYVYFKRFINRYLKDANINLNINDYSNKNLDKRVYVISYKSEADLLIAYDAINTPATFALDYRRIKGFYNKQISKFIEAERIDTLDLKDVALAFIDIQREINENRSFIFQPQLELKGDYIADSFKPVIKTKANIIPVVIKNSNLLDLNNDLVDVEVNILKEIKYEDYKDLNKIELCNLVKQKLEE